MPRLLHSIHILLGIAVLTGMASVTQAQIYDPSADFDAIFAAGTNQTNGIWTYGWSATLTSALTVYSDHRILPIPGTTLDAWDDLSNNIGFTPLVFKNNGGAYIAGGGNVPSGALVLYGGGQTTQAYSHVLFTAPTTGNYLVDMTFTGRQANPQYDGDVHILHNAASLFSQVLTGPGTNVATSYMTTLSLAAGDTLDFAVGTDGGTGFFTNTTQLSGMIQLSPNVVPEPAFYQLSVLLAGGGMLLWRRRTPRPKVR